MISDSLLVDTSFMGAPGIEEVKWLAPLRPGARVKVRATVLEARPSRSRPDMGFVKFAYELIDETGAAVLNLTVIPMFGRRTAGEARTPAALQVQDRA
jgi:acyl dehydratase